MIENELITDVEDRDRAIGGFLNQLVIRLTFTASSVTMTNTIRIGPSLNDLGRLIFVTLMVGILIVNVLTRSR